MDPVAEVTIAEQLKKLETKPTVQTPGMELVFYEILSRKPRRLERLTATAEAADEELAEGADGPDPDVFRIVLVDETPVDRGYAVLTWSCKKSAVDLTYARNGLSLLLEHGNPNWLTGAIDPALHIGILENLEAMEGARNRVEGDMRFSRSDLGQQIKRDVMDGTRRFMSGALVPLRWKVTQGASGEGSEYRPEERLVTRWMAVEGSVVSIPAIPTAMVKNSASLWANAVVESDTPGGEAHPMNQNENVTQQGGAAATGGAAVAVPPVTVERHSMQGAQPTVAQAVEARNKEIADIVELCNAQGVSASASDFIREGITADQAARRILQGKVSAGTVKGVSAEIREGLPAKDRRRWSLLRALDRLCLRDEGKGDFDGVEGEIHKFLETRAVQMGLPTNGGLMIPHDVRELPPQFADVEVRRRPRIERQAMVSNVAQKGGEFVLDSPGGFIEFLANSSVGAALGAEVMTDLVGNVPFAKQQGDVTVSFVGENPASAVTKTDMATGQVTLIAKTMQGAAAASRQLLRLASYSYEDKLMNSFARAHGLAFDRNGIHGTGAAGQCTGIYVAPDVGAVACGSAAPTYQKILDHISAVGAANALGGRLGFVTTVQLAARLKNQYRTTNTFTPLWEGRLDDGAIEGYRAIASNQISAVLGAGANEHGFIFGNWAELIYGMWGGLEIVIDNITSAGQGMVNFTSFQMGDVILRHGQSFAKATAATLT